MDKDQEAAEKWLLNRFPAYTADRSVLHVDVEVFLAGAAYGRQDEREEILEHLQDYRMAYAGNLFEPIKKGDAEATAESPSLENIEKLMTRTSMHMGRFVLDNLIKDLSK